MGTGVRPCPFACVWHSNAAPAMAAAAVDADGGIFIGSTTSPRIPPSLSTRTRPDPGSRYRLPNAAIFTLAALLMAWGSAAADSATVLTESLPCSVTAKTRW